MKRRTRYLAPHTIPAPMVGTVGSLLTEGSDQTISGTWIFNHLKKAMGIRNAADYASGSSTGGIQEAINDLPV